MQSLTNIQGRIDVLTSDLCNASIESIAIQREKVKKGGINNGKDTEICREVIRTQGASCT